jgi:hypothetical protein
MSKFKKIYLKVAKTFKFLKYFFDNVAKIEFFDFFESLIFLLYSFKTVFNVLHDLKNSKIGQFWPHLWNLNHVLKKVGRASSGNLFSI